MDFLNVIWRAGVMLFFCTFWPFTATMTYVFLLVHTVLQVYQLLFYYRRPTTVARFDPSRVTWSSDMLFIVAVP